MKKEESGGKEESIRPYKVYAINNGTVIDHLPVRSAIKAVSILGLDKHEDHKSIVTIGINLSSGKLGSKDVLKIENKILTKDELNKIALVAPGATINIIKNHNVYEKIKVHLPEVIEDILVCENPNCITRNQDVQTRFLVKSRQPLKIKCYHCERYLDTNKLVLK